MGGSSSGRMKGDDAHVVLLRGVNVGGKNRLPMADLVTLCRAAGCREATTYIQSGNAVVRASAAVAKRLPERLSALLAEHHGLKVPVLVRSAAELRAVRDRSPFLARGADPAALHVGFLADLPTPENAARLDPSWSPGDEFALVGREFHLHVPNGLSNTKVTNAWLDSRLRTVSSMRNWRTLLALIELCEG